MKAELNKRDNKINVLEAKLKKSFEKGDKNLPCLNSIEILLPLNKGPSISSVQG